MSCGPARSALIPRKVVPESMDVRSGFSLILSMGIVPTKRRAARFGIGAAMHEGLVTFPVEAGEQFVPRLFAELTIPIRSVSVSRPSLDDVFMSYTGKTIRDAEASGTDNLRAMAARLRGRR